MGICPVCYSVQRPAFELCRPAFELCRPGKRRKFYVKKERFFLKLLNFNKIVHVHIVVQIYDKASKSWDSGGLLDMDIIFWKQLKVPKYICQPLYR